MKRPLDRFGDVVLADLEHMTDDVAEFIAGMPDDGGTRSSSHFGRLSKPASGTGT
jgi:hypothetical protein